MTIDRRRNHTIHRYRVKCYRKRMARTRRTFGAYANSIRKAVKTLISKVFAPVIQYIEKVIGKFLDESFGSIL